MTLVKLEREVEQFITEVIVSLLMWELVVFIASNPGITDNADGIAGRLGRRRQDIIKLLDQLCDQGILKKWGDDDDPVFAYQSSSKYSTTIEHFLELNRDKEGRLFIWSQLLKHGMR